MRVKKMLRKMVMISETYLDRFYAHFYALLPYLTLVTSAGLDMKRYVPVNVLANFEFN